MNFDHMTDAEVYNAYRKAIRDGDEKYASALANEAASRGMIL